MVIARKIPDYFFVLNQCAAATRWRCKSACLDAKSPIMEFQSNAAVGYRNPAPSIEYSTKIIVFNHRIFIGIYPHHP